MNTQNEIVIKFETLVNVLSKMLCTSIIDADYNSKHLYGGTLGDVQLISGNATDTRGRELPYQFVLKKQRKWERYGDPGSWRREYDLYTSDLGKLFDESLRWPECYYIEISDDEFQIWMEYIEGTTGENLTIDMYEGAAKELGRFQGRLYAMQPDVLKTLTNLSNIDFMKKCYLHYRSWNEVYDYIRSDDCSIPKHLCDMLIDLDENSDEVFNRIERLPLVLCHRDFWVTNIFYNDEKIVLIDWDTSGWGYMGEDIASLIADESDVGYMVEYYNRCIPAYYKGFSEHADISYILDNCIYEMILIKFGYRLVESYKFAELQDEKALSLNTLQKIYDMKV